jgi:hypothetical protein
MKWQCAWCHPPGSPERDPDATHGMCEECLRKEFPEIYLAKPNKEKADEKGHRRSDQGHFDNAVYPACDGDRRER